MSEEAGDIIRPHVARENKGLLLPLRIRKDPLGFFSALGEKNGSHAWLSLMGSRVLFVNDATAVGHILAGNHRNYHKGKYNENLRPLLGDGIFLSEDALWKQQRHDAAPVFSGRHFPGYAEKFNAAADDMLKRWEPSAAAGTPVDMGAEFMRFALDVALRTLFHEESEEALQNMKGALGTMLRMAEKRIWSPVNPPLGLALRLPKYAKTLRFIDKITDDLIDKRRGRGDHPDDLLSRLVASHGNTAADRKLLRDNVLSFLLAGHETTANGLSWTFYEMARHPRASAKAVAEIDAAVTGKDLGIDAVGRLEYTRQCFHEALRLYPPVWTTSREALKDDLVPLDDGRRLAVPAGATVMLCTYTVHRRRDYWSDPDAYEPERLSPARSAGRPDYAWFAYGGGARKCLGSRFADTESLVAIAKAHRAFDIRLVPGQDIRPEPIITLRQDRPALFTLRPRVRENTAAAGPARSAAAGKPACPYHAGRG